MHSTVAMMKKVHGSAWLGKINGNGRRTLWEWKKETVIDADFVLPRYDAELDALLTLRYKKEYTGVEDDARRIQVILDRIKKINGQLL